MKPMNAPDLSLDKIIAQKLGELTIQTAKQAVMIEVLKLELAKRDAEIARLKAVDPELPLEPKAAVVSEITHANGKAH